MDWRRYRVEPGSRVRLREGGAGAPGGREGDRKQARKALAKLTADLRRLQAPFYAESRRKLLIVLQGMDTAGKDGTIRQVFKGLNPQGVRVVSFKVPSEDELAHDYLWRVHREVPGRGEIVIFNRSHCEDVLVVRVHRLVPGRVWKRRFDHINDFERMLADEGTTILKFFLHISRAEQRKRLVARLEDPDKRWKFRPGDLEERARWPAYLRAYEDLLEKTSTPWAPWYIVPSDSKRHRNLVVASALVETVRAMGCRFPRPRVPLDPAKIV